MEFPNAMMYETIWFERQKYEADRDNYERYLTTNLTMQVSAHHHDHEQEHAGQGLLSRASTAVAQVASSASSALINEIAEIRDSIKQSLTGVASQVQHAVTAESDEHISDVEKENKELRILVSELCEQVKKLDARVTVLEANSAKPNAKIPSSEPPAKKPKVDNGEEETCEKEPEENKEEEEDSDEDLFGSDDETEEEKAEAEKRRQELVDKYKAKKAGKPQVIAKSSILIDVKPWDDETDMEAMEKCVRSIEMDGLLWGASKLIPLAYGIRKLQISCVVEDDKVGTDILEEKITEFEDYVQSMDIAAFNKI